MAFSRAATNSAYRTVSSRTIVALCASRVAERTFCVALPASGEIAATHCRTTVPHPARAVPLGICSHAVNVQLTRERASFAPPRQRDAGRGADELRLDPSANRISDLSIYRQLLLLGAGCLARIREAPVQSFGRAENTGQASLAWSHTVITLSNGCSRSEERRVGKEGRSRWSA